MFSYFSELFLTDNGPESDSVLSFCNDNPNIHVFYYIIKSYKFFFLNSID